MPRKTPRKGAKPTARASAATRPGGSLRFSRINAILGVAGIVSLTLGYALLANGSITAAPLLLVLGYVVLLPMAIIL